MNTTDSASRPSLKESIPAWPHLSWVSSYDGADNLSLDPSRAVLEGVRERGDAVVITAREGHRNFTAAVSIDDPGLRGGIVAALAPAFGTTLNDLSDVSLSVER